MAVMGVPPLSLCGAETPKRSGPGKWVSSPEVTQIQRNWHPNVFKDPL